ncbi:response regulator [Sulfurospirillum multivorans]|uniref:Response regulator n=2 Tax=Sulfurospirillum multivorans TaxID=66821 RepID=A0AA86APE1_SULMK|nr:response regulator [Sulfurospirillum multivorans]AHJ13969.1 putative response regulator [Sulfurospirillum multivorans DSM 12446]QEH07457.1 putative response regulator [Sulfurospirillum multivorans]
MYKVLIVDDNDNNRLTLNLLLEEVDGIEIFEAEDGQVAVEMCVKNHFDLIFMDIMMPVLDGFEATQFIKQVNKKSMIIALSALDDDTSKNRMLSLGAEDYLTKPLNAEHFLQRIRQYLRIIALRNKQIHKFSSALNPFNAHVFHRNITFRIDDEEALAQFWDYWLNCEKNIINLSDCVRLIYGFVLWLLKHEYECSIVVEESEEKLYMMLLHVKPLNGNIIKNILLKHFANAKYILSNDMLTFQLDKEIKRDTTSSSVEMSDETKKILSKTHDNVQSAVDYINSTAISFLSKIDGLEIINDDTDKAILVFEKEPNKRNLSVIYENFQEYAEILAELMEFEHLGFAVRTLIDFLGTLTEEQFDTDKSKRLSAMLLNLLHDLSSWRENVFITQVARDIHYLDSSLLSSCIQIEAIFDEKSLDPSHDDDIEFF